jgi:hypothetical protein
MYRASGGPHEEELVSNESDLSEVFRESVVAHSGGSDTYAMFRRELIERHTLRLDVTDISQVYHRGFNADVGILARECVYDRVLEVGRNGSRIESIRHHVRNGFAVAEANRKSEQRIRQLQAFTHKTSPT